MMFKKMKNLETAFQHVRGFTIAIVACAFLTIGFITWQNKKASIALQSKVYILSGNTAWSAIAVDKSTYLPMAARGHVRAFHEAFFTLDPDEKVINANISRALYLADGSARRVYDGLKEGGYYSGVIAGNISVHLAVDSIAVEAQHYPIYFRCFGTETIVRPTSKVTRNLVTEGWLRYVGRSDNNPHGFLIEKWTILDNSDLKVETR